MNHNERLDEFQKDDHQKFKELAALATTGTLRTEEQAEFERHLRACPACARVYEEFTLISREGMSFLSSAYSDHSDEFDADRVRRRLLDQIEREPAGEQESFLAGRLWRRAGSLLPHGLQPRWTGAAVAAVVLIAVAGGAFHFGMRTHGSLAQSSSGLPQQLQALTSDKAASQQKVAQQAVELAKLQTRMSANQSEIARLREALRASENRSALLSSANSRQDDQLRALAEQRDKLASQLSEAEQSYRLVQAELSTLRAEHDRVLVHMTALESKVDELTAASRDQDRKLRDDETYLASDRDIRELMGARKLYIADVFDVDSGSRTRKPFGRVFYTQSKSLIFYAFDLDRQPGVKNASAFQVWGQRDGESSEKIRATNLGILYMDSESNRRWVLRLDDPKQLAELDAVFVTVEPQGGSQKPTGKPFLYALLRREANHP